jgi:hypothetical protein
MSSRRRMECASGNSPRVLSPIIHWPQRAQANAAIELQFAVTCSGELVMRGGLNEADRHDRAHVVGRKSIETRSGLNQGSERLAYYYPLIVKAVSRLEPNTTETRGKIYDRARTAMLLQLSSVIPSLTESEIGREQLALEEAIKKVETESIHHLRAPAQPSIRPPHRPSRPVKDISDVRAVANDGNAWSSAVVQDEDRACGAETFASKLALSKPDLSVELEDLQNQIRHHNPLSSIVRKLVPIAIMASLVFAATGPGAY